MFKYLWMVTQDLFLCVTLTTLMHVMLSRLYGCKGSRLHGIALCMGTLASAALDQSYSDGIRTMTFSEIPAGKLVLDLNRQTAAVDGSSIMSAYSFDSSFIYPHVGRYTIAGTGTVVWSERWE